VTNDLLGLTSIIVSHDVEEVAQIADEIHVIANGKVTATGTPTALRESSSELVRQFITGAPDGPVPFHFPATDYREDLFGGFE
jgi:phospholipid/cholesterol/gamma-HCH transport system ATP-binding protein